MQSTPICENKATRALARRRRNDAFSSPSALFQGYRRSNGWIYGVLMCHDSVNHVFFPISFALSDEAGWEKIFIKLKEQAVKWAMGASGRKHQDSSTSKLVISGVWKCFKRKKYAHIGKVSTVLSSKCHFNIQKTADIDAIFKKESTAMTIVPFASIHLILHKCSKNLQKNPWI